MKLSLAKIISLVFHPMAAVFFAPLLLIYKTTHDFYLALYWTMYTSVFILLLMVFTIIAVKKKIFSDIDVSKREQRPLLYQVGSFFGIVYVVSLFFPKSTVYSLFYFNWYCSWSCFI